MEVGVLAALASAVMCADTRSDNLQPVETVGAYREGMAITAARQRNAVSEGAALGLVMCGHFDIPSETWRVSLAFEGAWRAWEDRYNRPFSQVSTDLRQGLNGYIAMTRADERKHVFSLFWDRSGPTFKIYAREWCSGDDFDADEVAASIDGGLPATAWQALAQDFLDRMAD